ncbi:MAG: OadG family protein [Firmicutes bacterium]|nr:OadG family protein [Bacillota bacterium]
MEVTTTGPAQAVNTLTFGDGVLYAILGMLVVFFALVLIMLIIKILVKATDKSAAKKAQTEAAAATAPAEEAPAEPAPVKKEGPAPGTAGDIKLYNTDPKDAAMIMAIVADALGKPLNELRFKSIREIKE